MNVHTVCTSLLWSIGVSRCTTLQWKEPLKGSGRKLAAKGCDIREWGETHGISCGHNIENSLDLLPFWIHIPVHHKRGGKQVEYGWLQECLNLNKQLILIYSWNAIHPNKDEDHPGC